MPRALTVQDFLGHRSIMNTMKYIQLYKAYFKERNDEYICRAAKTPQEVMELIEKGFTFECEFKGVKLFRKSKTIVW